MNKRLPPDAASHFCLCGDRRVRKGFRAGRTIEGQCVLAERPRVPSGPDGVRTDYPFRCPDRSGGPAQLPADSMGPPVQGRMPPPPPPPADHRHPNTTPGHSTPPSTPVTERGHWPHRQTGPLKKQVSRRWRMGRGGRGRPDLAHRGSMADALRLFQGTGDFGLNPTNPITPPLPEYGEIPCHAFGG